MKTTEFFNSHPVFNFEKALEILNPPGGRKGLIERLKYHLKAGRLKRVTKGVYAVVPFNLSRDRFSPDTILTASMIRPDGVFSYHSALELLGVAHSAWHECSLFTDHRRSVLQLNGSSIRFLEHPKPFRSDKMKRIGTRKVERLGDIIVATGPERTLVEGFRRPFLAGGFEELVLSASGFAVLDLDLLEKILHWYDAAYLWAAVGWFLEKFQKTFFVSQDVLINFSEHRPKAMQYLGRNSREGEFVPRWNLILPKNLLALRNSYES